MRWTHTPPPEGDVDALSRQAEVSRALAELLLRAGLTVPDAAAGFLQPALSALNDPFLLPNVTEATDRLCRAIAAREEIIVLGDYDVDGVSSTALLVMMLRRFGLNPRFVVPRRSEDGYGLSRSAIDRALEAGRPGLFIALDCGTNSLEESRYLRGLGIDVMIIDHHRSKEGVVADGILINPHVASGAQPEAESWLHLCTVGLVFKLCHGLLKRLRQDNHPVAFRVKLRDHLDLVAMGTIADLVPLVGKIASSLATACGSSSRRSALACGR
jgi:single-stranded-DNA-specific exonuclease